MQTSISRVRHRFAMMFDESVTRAISIFLLFIIGVRYGSPLQCYVCTSLANTDCSSSLSTVSLTTCIGASGTDADSDAIASSSTTAITEATTESTSMKISSDTSETTVISGTTANATSDETTNTEASPTVTNSEDNETTIPSIDDPATDVVVRLVRDAAETEFSCYTLILTVDGTTVTDRGCAVTTTATCDDIMADKYPAHNKTSCITCTDDGCNSSSTNICGIASIALPLLVIYLKR